MQGALRDRFWRDLWYLDYDYDVLKVLTVAVLLPSGAIEVITNTDKLAEKIEYYLDAYDEDFRLKSNPEIKIVGYMLV